MNTHSYLWPITAGSIVVATALIGSLWNTVFPSSKSQLLAKFQKNAKEIIGLTAQIAIKEMSAEEWAKKRLAPHNRVALEIADSRYTLALFKLHKLKERREKHQRMEKILRRKIAEANGLMIPLPNIPYQEVHTSN